MGIIAKLKHMFSNNIVYNSDNLIDLGGLYRDKSTKLKLGSSIVIEDKSVAVISYRGALLEYLHGQGKFRVDKTDMPHLFEKIVTKKDPDPKKVNVDLYFINTNPIVKFGYMGDKSFVVKSKKLGKVTGMVEGVCTLQITNVRNLFDWLYMIRTKWRVGSIEKVISREIGNIISRIIERSKVAVEDIVLKKVNINECINSAIENSFEDLGFKVNEVELIGITFNNKIQPKINALIMQEYERTARAETKYITIDTTVEVDK